MRKARDGTGNWINTDFKRKHGKLKRYKLPNDEKFKFPTTRPFRYWRFDTSRSILGMIKKRKVEGCNIMGKRENVHEFRKILCYDGKYRTYKIIGGMG